MTLLYFADTRFPIERANGTQTMATCHALARRGHRVTLVVRPDSSLPPRDPFAFYDLEPVPALTIHTVRVPGGARARRAAFLLVALRKALANRDAVTYTRDLGFAAFLLQVPASRRPRVAYESHGIADVVRREMPGLLGHASDAPSASTIARLERREARVWRRADAYVTITRALADDLTSRYGARGRLAVVPDGARLEAALEATTRATAFDASDGSDPASPRSIVAGYAGHLYPWKGVDVFVRAIALTSRVTGLIVGGHPGEPDLARVQARVRDLGLGERVTITGLVPPAEVRARLAPASVLVLPNPASTLSERYTSPLKLFEYLAMGRAIVASDLPAIREVLTPEETALLVPPGDPAALARALDRIAGDAGLSARLAASALRLAPEYTWDRRAERIETLLKELPS